MIDNEARLVYLENLPLDDKAIRARMLHLSFTIIHPAVVMRKQAFDETVGYRSQFLRAEDHDLWLRIIEGWEVANLPDIVLRKRIHSQQISVCYVKQQVFSALGAMALSLARQSHGVEPTLPEPVISEEFLEKLGVSQTSRRGALVGAYSYWISQMSRASHDDAVVRLVDELNEVSKSGPVDKPSLSDAMLLAARSHYRRRRPVRALASLGRAVLTRPVVAGRPIKRAVECLFGKSQVVTGRA